MRAIVMGAPYPAAVRPLWHPPLALHGGREGTLALLGDRKGTVRGPVRVCVYVCALAQVQVHVQEDTHLCVHYLMLVAGC